MLNAHIGRIGRIKKLANEDKKRNNVQIEHSKNEDKNKGDSYDSVF